jgi:hypothetical protein
MAGHGCEVIAGKSRRRKKQIPVCRRAASDRVLAPRKNRGKKKARGTSLGMTALKPGKRKKDAGPKSPGATLTLKATIVDGSLLARIGNAEIVRTAIMFDSCETA